MHPKKNNRGAGGAACSTTRSWLLALALFLAATCILFPADRKKGLPNPAEVTAFSGKAVETTNAASYTYVRVDTGKEKLWAAAPRFDVKVGDDVKVTGAMAMTDYHSKTLNRKFPLVYFSGSIAVNGKVPQEKTTEQELPKGHPPVGGIAKPSAQDFLDIKKPAGGKTVAEIVSGKAKLKNQNVQVRGKVVKYNAMVMGKNWLHIRDGSGAEGNNDLTVTTATEAKVGDTVLVSGKVLTDRDFGSGYRYAVIIEDAKVTVESPAAR